MNDARMTAAEAVTLCRMAKAACPQQQFDQYTPDAWFELLKDLRFEDAKDAMFEVVKRQPFVAPAEIRDGVASVRKERLRQFGPVVPPRELADRPAAEQAWVRELVQRICDGEVTAEAVPPIGEVLGRVMPDWDRMLPAPPPMTRTAIAATGGQKPDRKAAPGYKEGLEQARAGLAARRPIPTPEDAALATAEPEDAS